MSLSDERPDDAEWKAIRDSWERYCELFPDGAPVGTVLQLREVKTGEIRDYLIGDLNTALGYCGCCSVEYEYEFVAVKR